MKIEQITPTDNHYIVSEEELEVIKSKIILSDDSKKNLTQKVYKIRCIPNNAKFKVGQRVIISMNPQINLVKINDMYYPILKEYDILGVVED